MAHFGYSLNEFIDDCYQITSHISYDITLQTKIFIPSEPVFQNMG